MAEVDNAGGFGDFKFVTAVDPKPKINGRDSTVSDDDWGDFVTDSTSQIKAQAVLSNGITYSQSPPSQIPVDPLGFFVPNGSAPTRTESEPIRVETEPAKVDKTRWVKPQGAFPLSLFGEEQEEDSGAGESKVGDVANEGFAKKESNLNVRSVGIDDLIANLYGHNPKVVVRNGSDSNFGPGGPNSTKKGLDFSANGMDLKFDAPIPSGNGKFGGLNFGSNDFDLKFDDVGSNSNTSVSNSGSGGPHTVKNGLNFSADALDLKLDALVPKENGTSGGLNLGSNGFDLKFDGVDSNSNTHGLKLDLEVGNGDFDEEDDDGWEFKAADLKELGAVEVAESKAESSAHARPGIQVDEKWQANTGGSGFSGGFSFDFNPKPVTQHNFFFDPLSKSKQNSAADIPNSTPVNGNLWEFKDAFSETGAKHKLEEARAANPAGFGSRAHNDFFAAFHGDSHKSGENFAFPFIPTSSRKHGVISDSHSSGKKEDIEKDLSSSPDVGSDDNFWEFKDAFSESGSNIEGELVVGGNPPANIKPSVVGFEIQHNEVTLEENHRRALPLSIFGDDELETDDSSIQQDISSLTTASHQVNTNKSPASNLSITDLISSLYSQVDQNTNTIHAPKPTENIMDPAPTVLESNFGGGDDFDEDSWEFKDAVSSDQNQTSIATLEDSPHDSSAKVHLDNYVDLYCKLKDETYGLALYHLENKKKAQSGAPLSGEDTTIETMEEEIQKLYNELHQHNMISDQFESGNLSSRNTHIQEVRKLLQDPKFQVLESEYQLSQRLSLAENDLRSAVELSRHTASTLRILRLGSIEEQSNYISTWSRIVSFCAEELKHGSLIWRQSLEANVQNQILSEPQGKQYIVALGEIYRVVLVLEASAKLYESWILLHSSNCFSFFSLLNECSTLWSSSGLDEALKSISDAIDFKYDDTVAALLDSMTYIHHLDAFALQNQVVNGQEPICSLSLLTAGAVPGIKMVMWDGENYLLTLANLWANLISPNPPELPHLSYS